MSVNSGNRIVRVLKNPFLIVKKIKFKCFEFLSRFFAKSPFFMQGQMDIHANSPWYNPDFVGIWGGFQPQGANSIMPIVDLEPWDNVRRDMLILLLRSIVERNTQGAIAELGVYKGFTSKLFHHYLPERKLYLFDTFSGFDERDLQSDQEEGSGKDKVGQFSDTSMEAVKKYISPINDNVLFFKGFFPESCNQEVHQENFAFVHLDADLYEPTIAGLKYFYPKLQQGGIMIVHDYNAWIGARKAVEQFSSENHLVFIPMPDKSGSAVLIKA